MFKIQSLSDYVPLCTGIVSHVIERNKRFKGLELEQTFPFCSLALAETSAKPWEVKSTEGQADHSFLIQQAPGCCSQGAPKVRIASQPHTRAKTIK